MGGDVMGEAKASRAAQRLMQEIGVSLERAMGDGVSAARLAQILGQFAEDYRDIADDSQWSAIAQEAAE